MGSQSISTTSPMISNQLCPTNQSGLDMPLPWMGIERHLTVRPTPSGLAMIMLLQNVQAINF